MRALTDRSRLDAFMREIAPAARAETRIYFTGGATAVFFGWRQSTLDIDVEIVPDSDAILREIPAIKERLQINVELACPSHFIPELPGWTERSTYIDRIGAVTFLHYDLYSQALSKIERSHQRDTEDVSQMLQRNLIEPQHLRELFSEIEPNLYRYPAIDPAAFRRRVDAATARALTTDDA